MIVATDDLGLYRGRVTMVDGGFDPLHAGHVDYFEAAAALGPPLLCNVAPDEWVARKHRVLLPQAARGRVVDAIRFVSYTHLSTTSTAAVIDALAPRYYAKGEDWRGRLPAEETAACERHGVEVVFLDTVSNSSTSILSAHDE